jgi:hypothetical protein
LSGTRRYGVHPQQLTRWRRADREGRLEAGSAKGGDFVRVPMIESVPGPAVPQSAPADDAIKIIVGRSSCGFGPFIGDADRRDRDGAQDKGGIIPSQGLRIVVTVQPVDFAAGTMRSCGIRHGLAHAQTDHFPSKMASLELHHFAVPLDLFV